MDKAEIINLPKIEDQRGNLSFVESNNHIPFIIKRTYWIYDVPGGETRGGHAFKENHELIIALSGSFDVVLSDGKEKKRYNLNRSYYGLYVPNMIWRSMENFSTNSLAVVISSIFFDEKDYIRDFNDFKRLNERFVSIHSK
jgi:WxcM-like protein